MNRRASLLLIATVAATLAATLAPSEAASHAPAVKGGRTQAYQAGYHVTPRTPVFPGVRYYLTGNGQDQVNKLQDAPTASFSKRKPTATSDITQQTSPVVSVATAGGSDPASAYWTAPFTGKLDGVLTLRSYWSTRNSLSSPDNLDVHVIADPGTAQEKVIGAASTGVTVSDGSPHGYTVLVKVAGTVSGHLRIQGSPHYVDAGNDLTAHYGSISAPSWVSLPSRHTELPGPPSTKAIRDTNPLAVSATAIGRDAGEPTIGVTKQGNAFMTAAASDGISPANGRTMIYASNDGNTSWHNVTPLYAGQPIPPVTLDPYIYVDPDTGRVFNDDLTAACSYLSWSDDQGKSWTQGNPFACEAPIDDHQSLVTGKPPAGVTTTGYPKVVYYCVNKVVDSQCARSTDGGASFTFTGGIPFSGVGSPEEGGQAENCGGLHGGITTDPAGRLLVPKDQCGYPMLAVSDDAGSTWRSSIVSRVKMADGPNPSVATDSAGNIYYLWLGADDLLPYLAVSRDHGRTWGPSLLVAPPGLAAANLPSLAAGRTGHIAISFPGTTSTQQTAGRPWNYYVAVSTDALAKLPTFHSTTSNALNDPIHRGPCLARCAGMLDFLDVVIAPRTGELWATEVDTCTTSHCIDAQPTATDPQANDAAGVAVRQLSGPGLSR